MVALHIILWHFALVNFFLFGKEIHCVDFLQECITLVFFICQTRAALKVSFFGPFYGGYNVIALDREYRHALVCGPDRDYLWILSRTPTISDEVKQEMLAVATREGFDVSKFIWVQQPGS